MTGAGISAEGGLKSFRDSGGLWEGYRVEEVATPEAWAANPKLVFDFYNERKRQLHEVEPNDAHRALAKLEGHFDVSIITQNVDNLHERGGSTNVLHLYGELDSARSTVNPDKAYHLEGKDIDLGESVPAMVEATAIAEAADILIVVGTSLARKTHPM